jgi:hypothetical protein
MPTVVSPSRGESRGPLRRRSLHRETVSVNKILGYGRFSQVEADPRDRVAGPRIRMLKVGSITSSVVQCAPHGGLCLRRIKNASCNQCMDFAKWMTCKSDTQTSSMLSMYISLSLKHYLFVGTMFSTNITGLHYDRPRAACDMLGPLEMFAT